MNVDKTHGWFFPEWVGESIWKLERETGIEPATNGLGSRDSTTELLPPVIAITAEIVTLCAILLNLPSFGLVNTQ